VIIPVAAIIAGLPLLGLPPTYDTIVAQASSLFILGAVSWLMFQIVGVGERFVLLHYDLSGPDNLSAADGAKAWDLRCEIREKLIFFVQRDDPKSLPRERSETPANIATSAKPTLPVSVLSYSSHFVFMV
jgi:hypothetical protein